jgi:hypothetical protein
MEPYILVIVAVVAAAALVWLAFYSDYRLSLLNEGFLAVPQELFVAKVVPGGSDEASKLSPGGAMDATTEKLLQFPTPMTEDEGRANWANMTSERCYRSDIGESLKKTRNYLQRTNNYRRSHPDDCSAPNHEFVGTFYTPTNGVGMTPPSGTPYPASITEPAAE